MVSLICSMALAQDLPGEAGAPDEPDRAWVSVAGGLQRPVLNSDILSGIGLVEVEGGAAFGPVRVGAQIHVRQLNVSHHEIQDVLPGDGAIASGALVFALPMELGPIILGPRFAFGAARWHVPMDPEFATEIDSEVGLTAVGARANFGVDTGLIVSDRAQVYLGLRGDAVYAGTLFAGLDAVLGATATF